MRKYHFNQVFHVRVPIPVLPLAFFTIAVAGCPGSGARGIIVGEIEAQPLIFTVSGRGKLEASEPVSYIYVPRPALPSKLSTSGTGIWWRRVRYWPALTGKPWNWRL